MTGRGSPGGCAPVALFAGLTVGALAILGLLANVAGRALGPVGQTNLGVVAAALALSVAAIGTARLHRWTPEELGVATDRGSRLWSASALAGLSVGALGSFLAERCGAPLARWLSWPESIDALARLDRALQESAGPTRLALLTLAVLIGPAAEELAFRGALWRALPARTLGRVLGTSLAFCVIHMDPAQAVGVLPLALVLGALRSRSRGLGPVLLAHALNNGLAFALVVGGVEAETSPALLGAAAALTLAAVGLVASAPQVDSGGVDEGGEDAETEDA